MEVPDCPVCWDRFDVNNRMPRLLYCGHTVCQLCLEYLPTETSLGQRWIRCPECRIPCVWRGVQQLPKNYILLHALDSFPDTNRGQPVANLVSAFLSHIQILFPFPNFVWVDGITSHRLFKQKVWELVKLTSIAALVFLFVPMSFMHLLLAWWTAAIGFLIFLWLFVAGAGFCIFIFFLWCSYNVFSGVCKYHKFIFKEIRILLKSIISFSNLP
ncbi:hypothetical protein SUGI_1114330 [Cryptomeria japonica]|nr:hypothetical protein SUGI_1114330 [Cryptomeria japonica]